ncbi:hypothetical protein ACTQ1N_11900, partial [Porcincola sp. LCP21S3_C12]|uniref:hypothetical protein n=1 Tax=Porcincola sp. LCP21S3_C12 TaxID=3438798 RepID=UPI003F9C46C9
ADQIPSISSNSKQRNLSPRVSKVVRDFGRGFVEQTLNIKADTINNFKKMSLIFRKSIMIVSDVYLLR